MEFCEFLQTLENLYSGYDDEFNESLPPAVVMESQGRRDPEDGDIWWYDWPHYNNGAPPDGPSKVRTVLIMNVGNNEKVAVMISKIAGKVKWRYQNKFSHIINDYKKANLFMPSFVSGNNIRTLETKRLRNYIGKIDRENYVLSKKKVELFLSQKFKAIECLMDYMNYKVIRDSYGYGDDRKILTFNELFKIGKGNSIDIANAVHFVAKKFEIPHVITRSVFRFENETNNHFYTITEKGNNSHVFRYFIGKKHDDSDTDLQIDVVRRDSNFDKAVKHESDYLKLRFEQFVGQSCTNENFILRQPQLDIWDKFVIGRKTQKELIEWIDEMAKPKSSLFYEVMKDFL